MRIPKEGLQEFEIGAINLHPSGLLNWRGPFLVHHAISQGHRVVKLTGHWMTEIIDEGPVLLQRDVEIAADTFGERIWSSIDRDFESLLRDILVNAPDSLRCQ